MVGLVPIFGFVTQKLYSDLSTFYSNKYIWELDTFIHGSPEGFVVHHYHSYGSTPTMPSDVLSSCLQFTIHVNVSILVTSPLRTKRRSDFFTEKMVLPEKKRKKQRTRRQ